MPRGVACPVCNRPYIPGDLRCPHCAADLMDPDVRAMAGLGAAPEIAAGAEGQLSVGKVLGVTETGLQSGRALRKLAILGAALLVAAWALPVWQEVSYSVEDRTLHMAWSELAGGNQLALLFPLIAAVLAIVAGFLPVVARGPALFVLGIAGFALSVLPLGTYGKLPTAPILPIHLGLALTAAAVVTRLMAPRSRRARLALIGSAAIVGLGMLVPTTALADGLPVEFSLARLIGVDLRGWNVPLASLFETFTPKAGQIFFSSFWALAPILLAPGAAALAWPRPTGAWDKPGIAVRPVAWLIVLYVPIAYALWTFTLMGWGGPQLGALAIARLRETALTLPLALWVAFGGAAVLLRYANDDVTAEVPAASPRAA